MLLLLLILLAVKNALCKAQFNIQQNLVTMLNNDTKFHDQWIHLIETQHRQVHQQDIGTALESVSDLLLDCTSSSGASYADHIDNVAPSDIQLYAEIGQLTRYCNDNIGELIKGELTSCQHASYKSSLPSIVKFLRAFNKNLKVIESPSETRLNKQTDYMLEMFRSNQSLRNLWKLIVIMPSMEDGEPKEFEQAAVEVIKAIKRLHDAIPQRTILVVIRISSLSLWKQASSAHEACHILLEPWKLYETLNPESVWDQVEKICEMYFQSSLFTVQILPLMRDTTMPHLPGTGAVDLSLLGHDCVHLSARGLSLLHIAIWNSLLTRVTARRSAFNLTLTRPICADPQCPFVRTAANSVLCIWDTMKDGVEASRRRRFERMLVLAVFLTALILFTLLLIGLYGMRRRRDRIKEADETPKLCKSFGADWPWRYIDEESSSPPCR